MHLDYDYIICGAGASGLSLATALSLDPLFSKTKILIIDPEFPKLVDDRTWCFWEEEKSSWDEMIFHSWNNVLFKSDNFSKNLSLKPFSYKMLKSKSRYNYSNQIISKNPNINSSKDKVLNVLDNGEYCEVKTSSGVYKSKKVFNSILNWELINNTQKYPLLIQHFEGWFIETEEDFFNTNEATFMDFSISQNSNTRFMYVLPFSKKEALIEYTLFSESQLNQKEYEDALTGYLKGLGIGEFSIKSKESGKIPMTVFPFEKQNSKNILFIGTAGGWSKPSTGYTFKNIERKTTAIVGFLKQENNFIKFSKKNRFWYYDLIFLDVLFQNNHLGSVLFTQMFKKNSPNLIFKFLDEKTSFIEEIKIMLSFPKGIFIKTILKRIFKIK
ncbi:MAG: lycopene cyclase family protein [Bacteroidetes bacterium]|nr:lycopene cyclase family protein [Bacteroidota bacterium]MDA1019486.1 lycopene cyclase family protein [Bacteroidota bacterium]